MRTHIFNQMTAREIEAYLASGKDAIFVAVGATQIYGNLPVEAENVLAEGLAVALAEKSDSVALVNLPFFYPGGSVIGSGTIYTSLRDGYEYLWKILESLMNQGFKKLFIVPAHENIAIMMRALIRDFFEATHVHPILIDLTSVLKGAVKHDSNHSIFDREFMAKYEAAAAARLKAALPDKQAYYRLICGAFSIMGKVDHLVVDPEAEECFSESEPVNPIADDFSKRVTSFGGSAGLLYENSNQYGGGYVFKSAEERAEFCAEGEKVLRNAVDALDLAHLLKAVGDYQEYALEVCEKFPRFNKLAEDR